MTTGARPGGLTAFAIINFVWAAMSFLGALSALAMPLVFEHVPTEQMPEKDRQEFEQAQEMLAQPGIQFLGAMDFVTTALLVISGIGYLKQKKVMGRLIGNLYALLAVTLAVVGFQIIDMEIGFAFAQELGLIIELVYPVLTLILLNTAFRSDFPN